jgi:hypothetical protein
VIISVTVPMTVIVIVTFKPDITMTVIVMGQAVHNLCIYDPSESSYDPNPLYLHLYLCLSGQRSH